MSKKMSPTIFSDFIQGHTGESITIPVSGISFIENIQKKISYIEKGDYVLFKLVDDNDYDVNAVSVVVVATTPKGLRKINVGWMPKNINGNYRFEVSQGCEFFAEVEWVFKGTFDEKGNAKKNPGMRINIYDFHQPEDCDDTGEFEPFDADPPF